MRGRRSIVHSPKPGATATMNQVTVGEVTLMRIGQSGAPRASPSADDAEGLPKRWGWWRR